MPEMTRRTFLVALGAASVAAATVKPWSALADEYADDGIDWYGDTVKASYDGGQTFFKMPGDVRARQIDDGERIEFKVELMMPREGLGGRRLSVLHPASGIWLDVA